MGVKFANNAEGTLAGPINASVTQLTLNSGQGARFPIVTSGATDFFYCTLTNVSGEREVIKVTEHTAGDVFQTIERAADNIREEAAPYTAYSYSTNDSVQLRLPKVVLNTLDLGTNETSFQIDIPNSGPRAKNNSGVLEVRNSADSAYAALKAITLEATGAITGGSTLTISGALSGATTISLSGAISGGTTITCSGLVTAGSLALSGTITGATTIAASGAVTAASLVLSGSITGATTIGASGAVTAASLVLSGTITGATNIFASGTCQANQLTSTANATITGTTVSGNFQATGNSSLKIDNQTTGRVISAGDHGTATNPEVVNVTYGTGSPPTASNTTIGSLFVKYIA
jgi:hypothetical protein